MTKKWCVLMVFLLGGALPAFSQAGSPGQNPANPEAWVKPPVEPGQRQPISPVRGAVFLPVISAPIPALSAQPSQSRTPQGPSGVPAPGTGPVVTPAAPPTSIAPVMPSQPAPIQQRPDLPLLSQSDSSRSGHTILVPGPSRIQPMLPMMNPQLPTGVSPHTAQGLPIRPAPVLETPKLISPADADLVKQIFRGVHAVRSLLTKPQSDALIRQVLGLGDYGAKLLRLDKFMSLPRFQSRYDETILRDRSYESWEYRRFGSFQTTLDGWTRTESLLTTIDWKFSGRGGAYVFVKGSLTKNGALSGRYFIDGSDSRRRKWHLMIEVKEVLLHDDGLPCAGSVKISGWDPTGRSMVFALDFPCPVGVPIPFPQAPSRMNPSPIDRR